MTRQAANPSTETGAPDAATAATGSAGGATGRLRSALTVEGALQSGAALVVIYVALLVAFTIASPVFLTGSNLLNVVASVATLGIVAAVQTSVIICGGFDLSVGSTAAFTSVVAAEMLSAGFSAWLAIPSALGVGAVVGAANAFVITKLNVNPLIATLGMMSIVRGAALVWTDALTVVYPADQLAYLGRARIGGVQVSIVFMVLTFVAVWAVLRYTVLGRFVFAVGGNPKAAFLSGVRVNRVRTVVYVASGVSAALAGLMIASQLIAGSPQAAAGLELSAVTAAVLGGASLNGGQGRVWMTLVGALIMGTLTNGLVLMDISSFWQMAVLGVVLILAVALDQVRTRTGRRS